MIDIITGILLLVCAIFLVVFSSMYLRMDKFRFHALRVWNHLGDELVQWAHKVSMISSAPFAPELLETLKQDCSPENASQIISLFADHAGSIPANAPDLDELMDLTSSLSTSIALYNKDVTWLNKTRQTLLGKMVLKFVKIPEMTLLELDLFHLFEFAKKESS